VQAVQVSGDENHLKMTSPDEDSEAATGDRPQDQARGQQQLRRRRRPRRPSVGNSSERQTSGVTVITSSSYSGDDSASSSDNDLVKNEQMRRKNKLRRSCKSTGSATSFLSLTAKAVQIETALKGEVSTAEATEEEQQNCEGGMTSLNELAISEHGLINDDFRRRAWPRLADLNIYATSLLPTQEEVESHKSYQQVVLDVNRSLKRFPPGISEEERPDLQDQLTRLIVRVLSKHPDLHYYQGYHDVAITFLLVIGEQLGFHVVEKLSSKHLKDFMAPTMEKTTYLLHFMYPIFRRECLELHDFLDASEVGTIFALPWLITWFSHVLPNYQDVVRLFDFFLAQPLAVAAPATQPSADHFESPAAEVETKRDRQSCSGHSFMMPVYLASALVLHRREEVLATDCDMASVHSVLSHIPCDLPLEKLLRDATKLSQRYPSVTLEPEVSERIAKIDEAVRKSAEANSARKAALLAAKKKEVGKDKSSPAKIIGFIVVAVVPVVLGVITWKYLENYSQ